MMEYPERLPERDQAIEAMLPNVPFDGWTKRGLKAGIAAAGMPADEAELLFPLGVVDMIETFFDLMDRRMEEAAATLTETSLTRRVRAVVALRLRLMRPYKEAVRRALAILAVPGNAKEAAQTLARTVDAIWHAAGDTSADFSWYTKRAILSAVYSATLLYWIRDTSENDADTLAFLDRQLRAVGRIGRLRARLPRLPFVMGDSVPSNEYLRATPES
jgi:ubiquinone biosynthesis protein COQ9